MWPSVSSFVVRLDVVDRKRPEPQGKVVVGDVETALQLFHLLSEPLERLSETLDLLLVDRARLDPAQRLAFHQPAKELDDCQDEPDEPMFETLATIVDPSPGRRFGGGRPRRCRRQWPHCSGVSSVEGAVLH